MVLKLAIDARTFLIEAKFFLPGGPTRGSFLP
jgi:hypothetical protein